MPAASAAPAAAPAGESAPVEEKPKEKTVFNVNLTKIDAAQKAKAIREVKALMTGMNLVEVRFFSQLFFREDLRGGERGRADEVRIFCEEIGQEVCRVFAKDTEGGSYERRGGEITGFVQDYWCRGLPRLDEGIRTGGRDVGRLRRRGEAGSESGRIDMKGSIM